MQQITPLDTLFYLEGLLGMGLSATVLSWAIYSVYNYINWSAATTKRDLLLAQIWHKYRLESQQSGS